MNTYHDSLVEEIHQTRKKLKEKYEGDMSAYSHDALAHCQAMGFNFANPLLTASAQPFIPADRFAPADFTR